jgi:quercetin dioxygenase-like cupin family protein
MAANYGLVLMENGNLIDTRKGEVVPEDQNPMPVTSKNQVDALKKLSNDQLQNCCMKSNEGKKSYQNEGMTGRNLIHSDTKLSWDHGFQVINFQLEPGDCSDWNVYSGSEVIFVQSGELTVKLIDETWRLFSGDTATIPKGVVRQFLNSSDKKLEFIRVRGDIKV